LSVASVAIGSTGVGTGTAGNINSRQPPGAPAEHASRPLPCGWRCLESSGIERNMPSLDETTGERTHVPPLVDVLPKSVV
jgi:hypothetical protein